jgi:uncharacterized protein YeaO (DUF488 family)
MDVRLKRAYDEPADDDGYRILIDRLWPRGRSKESLRLDEWARELAPSDELRRWFGHEPAKFVEFRRRYLEELQGESERVEELRRRARAGTVTIVFGARDVEHANGPVLAELLRED